MTNTMTKPMPRTPAIRILPPAAQPARSARARARRRRAILNTLGEALFTIGLGACFILCAVMMMCAFSL